MANTVTQQASFASYLTDPVRNFKFHVIINSPLFSSDNTSTTVGGFMSVSGLGIQTDIIAYRQGGYNVTTQKMPGQSDFGPIVLQKGIIPGDAPTLDWVKQLFQVQQGTGAWSNDSEFRANVDILVVDHPVTTPTAAVKVAFRIYNAWPTQVSFTDLDAGGNGFLVSQMTLAHEGWAVNIAGAAGSGSTALTPT
jgi:phage tail-like protein